MRNTLTVLIATTALAFGGAAMAADATYKAETTIKKDDDGSFKRDTSVESKDDSGRVATDVTVKKDVDSDGDVKQTTEVEKVNDPKGLWNKQTDKVKETAKVVDGKKTIETEHKVNGDTVSETKTN